MKFRTEIEVSSSKVRFNPGCRVVTIGSCLSVDIGNKFLENKFDASANPLGTVYNPISIHNQLLISIRNEKPEVSKYIQRNGTWFHYDFHSDWFGESKEELEEKLTLQLQDIHCKLKNCEFLIITYGTSWVFEETDLKSVVANCHKIPQSRFSKYIVTQKKILESFATLHQELQKINPGINIILTVSPVRHVKDTPELNSVSKSILRLACHTLSEQYDNVHYFPSYEIMIDDLRDYRFYAKDLIHPSEVAVDYIWEKFCDAYMSDEAKDFLKVWSKLRAAINHRPFHLESLAHQQFLKETLSKLELLNKTVDVQDELELVKKQLL